MPKSASAVPTAVRTAVPTAAVAVFRLAALFTFLAVAMGAVVCATGSGASCPTWPGCRPDQIAPQWQLSPLIEFTHRVVAMSAGPLVLAAAVMSRRLPVVGGGLPVVGGGPPVVGGGPPVASGRLPGRDWWVRILPWVALAGALAAGAFGRFAVLTGLPTWLGAVDLFSALMAMTTMGVAAALVGAQVPRITSRSAAARRPSPVAPLAVASASTLVVMFVTGIFTAGPLSYTRCVGWPIWQVIGTDLHPWLQDVRLGLAGIGAALVATTAVAAARHGRLRGWGVALGTLLAGEMVLGLVIRNEGINTGVAAAYSVLAVAVLWCLGLLIAVASSAGVGTGATMTPESPHHGEPAVGDPLEAAHGSTKITH